MESNSKEQSMYNLFDQMSDSIIKVIGVGGGGSNAVNYMYRKGIVGVDFAVCNTDQQALDDSPVPIKIQLGPHLTEGMGAGSMPEVGKQSCIESIDEVRNFLDTNTKMLFITAGMGGGTGTGAAPIIAKAAKEMGILTVAIVTKPFKFEGLRRVNQAMDGLEQLKKAVDAILVISNDRVKAMFGKLSFTDAFAKADDILATGAKGIAEIITVSGYINVDFKDVNTVMRNSGVAIMGFGTAEGENRAQVAVDEALNSPLLEDNDIRGAQHILLNICSGTKEVTMDEISEITEHIQEEAGYGTDLIWGNCKDDKLGDNLSITIIATGFDSQGRRNQVIEKKQERVHLADDNASSAAYDLSDDSNANVIEFDDIDDMVRFSHNKKEPYVKPLESNRISLNDNNSSLYEEKKRVVREIRKPLRPLDSPRDIADLEDIPAYKRKKISLSDDKDDDKNAMSKLSINVDENDNPFIERTNSFFKTVD